MIFFDYPVDVLFPDIFSRIGARSSILPHGFADALEWRSPNCCYF
jgi:hypothetical protein